MKRLLVFSFCTLTRLQAEVRLHGVIESDTRCLVALSASEENAPPRWVSVAATFRGYVVKRYDAKRELVCLEGKEGTFEVKLSAPTSNRPPSEIDITTLSDEGLVTRGLYRVHPGDTGMRIAVMAKLSITELLALNPGVNFSKLRPGQMLVIAKEPNRTTATSPAAHTPRHD